VRPQGWKAGASRIDKVANRLLIGIGVSLLVLRFAQATLYAEKWSAARQQDSSNDTARTQRP
jgi:O-antigen ligase